MIRWFLGAAVAFSFVTTSAYAESYNDPGNDSTYTQCLAEALKTYEGGGDQSKVKGQTNAEAWCICMWNETPDNFKGSIVAFAESDKGAKINAMCEKHSGWTN